MMGNVHILHTCIHVYEFSRIFRTKYDTPVRMSGGHDDQSWEVLPNPDSTTMITMGKYAMGIIKMH